MREKRPPRLLAGPPVGNEPVKFWNMVETGEDEAEITMYGDVCSRQPIDWWTGQPEPGMYITPEGFLEDLEQVKGKARVTIRINSGGGDLYTGMAIYTQLKNLSAHKSVVIDGIAASAASVIAMAGDDILIPVGGTIMIHEAGCGLMGHYSTHDVKDVAKMLEAANKSCAEVYADKTGKDPAAVRSMMAKTKWLVGQDAVDEGFATGLLEGEGPTMSLTADRRTLVVNGVNINVEGLPGIPKSIPVMRAPAPAQRRPAAGPQPQKGGNQSMEHNETITTTDQLAEKYPELVAQIRLEAASTERTRIQEIDDIASVMDPALVSAAKYTDPCSAQDLSFRSIKQQAKLGEQHLEGAEKDYEASGAAGVKATGDATADPKAQEQQELRELGKLYNSNFKNGGTR